MGSRAKGKKGEEQDFETFVRESLGSLRDDIRAIMRAQEFFNLEPVIENARRVGPHRGWNPSPDHC